MHCLFPEIDRLDIVAVGIGEEGRVIGRAVIGAQSCRAVVLATGLQPGSMEFLDRLAVGCCEGNMRTGPLAPLCA